MTTQTKNTSARADIVVEVPVEHAFAAFTERTVTWKPPEHNLLEVDIAESIFEAHEGGYVYDRGVDGSECRWAQVLVFEPPNRVVLSWLISPQWQLEADGSKASEVEVRFIAEAAERTRVEIEHRNLDRHGDGWEGMRDAVAAPDGWPLYLTRFAEGFTA
ncbi:MAG: SRPBCC family protein [Actinomycetota bacterium]|nr:SRPBCC family protein [Actinomycetota bacterium]